MTLEVTEVDDLDKALVIACSDVADQLSRCLPTTVQVLGNAGNIVPPHGEGGGGEAAMLEYALSLGGVTDVVVCGHACCRVLRAVLRGGARPAAIDAWLAHAGTSLRGLGGRYPAGAEEALLAAAVEENVLAQVEHLTSHPIVARRLAAGTLRLHGWVLGAAAGDLRVVTGRDRGALARRGVASPMHP